jgi:hypothetical protein
VTVIEQFTKYKRQRAIAVPSVAQMKVFAILAGLTATMAVVLTQVHFNSAQALQHGELRLPGIMSALQESRGSSESASKKGNSTDNDKQAAQSDEVYIPMWGWVMLGIGTFLIVVGVSSLCCCGGIVLCASAGKPKETIYQSESRKSTMETTRN